MTQLRLGTVIHDQIKDNGDFMCTQLFPHQHEANETHGVPRETNCFFSKLQKEKRHAWVLGLFWSGRRERASQAEPGHLIFFLLAPECWSAGGTSLRYYRELKPGKKTMYCFSPGPINFVINKSDSYRTACQSCLWKQGFISRIFIKIGYMVVFKSEHCTFEWKWMSQNTHASIIHQLLA